MILMGLIASAGILWALFSKRRGWSRLVVGALCAGLVLFVTISHRPPVGDDECGAGRYAWDC